MKINFATDNSIYNNKIRSLIECFPNRGTQLSSGRNEIRIFNVDNSQINIKSFKVPNAINKIAYKFFRKSKAQRSFEYASRITKKGIGTPRPIAYAEETNTLSFGKSFYVCEHQEYDLTYRELVTEPDYPDHESILRAFTRFTFELHEKQIQFLDHSPGNTLIRKEGKDCKFFLVDLNRMNFKELNFEERMMNFSRLTPKKEMVEIMAAEYSKLIGKPESEVFEKMWFYTIQFQEKFKRKKELKKKLKFWKK